MTEWKSYRDRETPEEAAARVERLARFDQLVKEVAERRKGEASTLHLERHDSAAVAPPVTVPLNHGYSEYIHREGGRSGYLWRCDDAVVLPDSTELPACFAPLPSSVLLALGASIPKKTAAVKHKDFCLVC